MTDGATGLRRILDDPTSSTLGPEQFHAIRLALTHITELKNSLLNAEQKLKRRTVERDEARQEVCRILAGKEGKFSNVSPDALEVAKQRNWDCFEERTENG